MTIWISTKEYKSKDEQLEPAVAVLEALENGILPEELRETPEWSAVWDAVVEKRPHVLSVALEVLVSHCNQGLRATVRDAVMALADSVRNSRPGQTRALHELLTRSAA